MIHMNNFIAEPGPLKEQMLAAVSRVIESGWYVLGSEVATFEQAWADVCGLPYAIGVGNGMDALEIALRSLAIGPGDEVITTPMTAFATVLAILRSGATPVLADIDPETALLDRDSIIRCVSPKTKAVILVHLYGQMRDMYYWSDLCDNLGISLIEDCAQSHLAAWQGQIAGSLGIAGAYSFYPTKNLGTLGDGGMLVTKDNIIAERSLRLRNYGQSVRYHHPEIGMNSRLDEIHAAILHVRLNFLPEFTRRRQQIAQRYMNSIRNPLVRTLLPPQELNAHVYHLFVITCDQRDSLQSHLTTCGVQSYCHYPIPVHHQAPCKYIRRDPQGLLASERHAKTCLSLPCHPQMSDQDVDDVIAALNQFQG